MRINKKLKNTWLSSDFIPQLSSCYGGEQCGGGRGELGLTVCGLRRAELSSPSPPRCHGSWLLMPGTRFIVILEAGNLTLKVESGLHGQEGRAPMSEDACHLNSHGG